MNTRMFITHTFAFLATTAALFSVAATPVEAYSTVKTFSQAEQRAPNGQITVEASAVTVVACNGPSEIGGQRYIYQYAKRHAFRAVNPPNWGRALGGQDWPTFDQAVYEACVKHNGVNP